MLHKHKQGNGVGHRSYQLLEETLKEEYNVVKIRLCVQVQNRKGVQFWQRNGFKKVGDSIDNNGLDIFLYEKVVQ
ncbi:MAG: GNAT family N-acetyltransferase [Bacillaceae bacterium]|nr:GNAT family N-acetyltransferase [Bacillaceae bacterium]